MRKILVLLAVYALFIGTLGHATEHILDELLEVQEIEQAARDEEYLQSLAEMEITDTDCEMLAEVGKYCGDVQEVVVNPFK